MGQMEARTDENNTVLRTWSCFRLDDQLLYDTEKSENISPSLVFIDDSPFVLVGILFSSVETRGVKTNEVRMARL